MVRKARWKKVKSGLILAAEILLAILGVFVLGLALQAIMHPGAARPGSIASHLSPASGWLILAGLAVVLFSTAHVWAKGLPAIFGYGMLNAAASIFTGKLPGGPFISRADAIILTVLAGATTVLSAALIKRKLARADRIGLSAFVMLLFAGMLAGSHWLELVAMGAGTGCLLLMWLYGSHVRRDMIKETAHQPNKS